MSPKSPPAESLPNSSLDSNLRRAERIFSERKLKEEVRSLVLKEDAGA